MATASRALEWRFPPALLVAFLLAALRFIQRLRPGGPELFTWLLDNLAWPLARRLEGALFRGIITRKPATGVPKDMVAEWITLPSGEHDTRTAILYIPGGAFLTRAPVSLAFAARLLPRLADERMPPPILVLSYSLPGCYDGSQKEIQAAIDWLQSKGFENIILAGDSAGGYLALQSSPTEGVLGVVGICPWLDLSLELGSWQQNQSRCFLTRQWIEAGRRQFLAKRLKNGTLRRDFGSLTSAAAKVCSRPTFLVACADDCIRDDVFAFRDAAIAAGADVEVFECQGPNCFHDALLLPVFHEASHHAAFDRMAETICKWLK